MTAQAAGFHGAQNATHIPPDDQANAAAAQQAGKSKDLFVSDGIPLFYCWSHGLLFLVEAVKAEGVVVCFHRIGKGANACVKENCLTNHGKTVVLTPVIGMLFILRLPTTIFIDSVMHSGLLSDDLFEEWMRDERSVESWRIKFSLAVSADASEVTSKLMAKSEAHLERAAEYKTPSKAPAL
jgi:hypothetical protein